MSFEIASKYAHHEHFRLHDGHKTVGLADGGVSSKSHSVLIDGDLRRSGTKGVFDVQNSSPLSETSPRLVVLGTSDIEVVNSLCNTFTIGPVQRLDSLVNLWGTLEINPFIHSPTLP